MNDSSLDAFLRGRLRLWQPRRGARVTMDPFLLADFARGQKKMVRGERVLDLGCGTGVMALAFALDGSTAVGVEIVPEMAALARRSVEENRLAGLATIVEGDLRDPRLGLPHAEYELILSNPPYQPAGRGRVPVALDRAVARSETQCTLGDVVEVARKKLSPRGRLAMILPAARLGEAFSALEAARLRPTAVRAVHSFAGEQARRALVAAGREGELVLLPPLVIHSEDRRSYTAEARQILGEDR